MVSRKATEVTAVAIAPENNLPPSCASKGRKSVNPNIRDGHYTLGRAYLNAGEYDEAIRHFQKVLEVDRDFIDGYHALALAYFGAHNLPGAQSAARAALKLDATYQPARSLLEAIEPRVPDPATPNESPADRQLEKTISSTEKQVFPVESDPPPSRVAVETDIEVAVETDVDKEMERGLAFLGNKQYQRAEAAFKKVLKAHPHDPHGHYNLAQTYLELGELTQAKIEAESALRLNPSYLPAEQLIKAITYHTKAVKRQALQKKLIRYLLPVAVVLVVGFLAIRYEVLSFSFFEKALPVLSIETTLEDPKNNNGVIDAGETVRLKVMIFNRGAAAKHLKVGMTPKKIGGLGYQIPDITLNIAKNGFHTLRIPMTADKLARTRQVPVTIQVFDKNRVVLATRSLHLSIKGK